MTVNLGLEVKLNRSRQSNLENISVQIILKKGDQGKLDLYDIKARLRIAEDSSAVLPRPITFGNDVSIGEQYKIVDVSNIRRLTLAEGKKSLSFERYSAESPNLRLAPADEMIFSCLFQVPIDTTCIVDVAVLGRKAFGSRTGQWRSSLVSIPATVGPAPIGALND